MITVKDLPLLINDSDSRCDWEKRRPEIKAILEQNEYGAIPPAITPTVKVEQKKLFFAGKGYMEDLTFSFEKDGESFSFPAKLIYPVEEKKYPFFVFANFTPAVPDKYFPAEEIIDGGCGVISFCYEDVSADKQSFGDGVEKLFMKGERADDTFGKISLWAWGMSRLMDYLLQRNLACENLIAAIGHSRLGKTALWAAANDSRFAFSISNESGCAGAAIARDNSGEKIADITHNFPHWFCKNYYKLAGNEDNMIFDQHFLLALIAPQSLVIGAAKEDTWANTYNQYLACKAAMPVYELYGKGGGFDDKIPETLKKYGENGVYFRERPGTHFLSRTDWQYYIELLRSAANDCRK